MVSLLLEYILRLVFKEKPDKGMVHDCMLRFDVDGKFTSSSTCIYLVLCLKRMVHDWMQRFDVDGKFKVN